MQQKASRASNPRPPATEGPLNTYPARAFPGSAEGAKKLMSICDCVCVTPSLSRWLFVFFQSLSALRGESGFHGNGTHCLRCDVSLHHKLLMALICMCARVSVFVTPPPLPPHPTPPPGRICKKLRLMRAFTGVCMRLMRHIPVWIKVARKSDSHERYVSFSF